MPTIKTNIVIHEITSACSESNLNEIKYQRSVTPIESQNSEMLMKNQIQLTNNNIPTFDFQSTPQSTINHQTNVQTNDTDKRSTFVAIKSQNKSSLFPQKISLTEDDLKCQTKRTNKCSPMLTYLTILAFILIAIAISAIVIAFNQPKVTSTTTTFTTTTFMTMISTTTTSITTISTTTTSITTISTTTTSTTTTARPFVSLLLPGDYIVGIYNTTAGGSTGGTNGVFSGNLEYPQQGIDGLLTTKYLNFGNSGNPGINTGFYVRTSISTATIACSLLFATGGDSPNRDPLIVSLEGTTSSALDVGSSWTVIYIGPTGIDPINTPSRSTYGTMQNFSNTIAYIGYRLLVTSKRGVDNSVQYSEAQIWGYY